jgi:hypothetical protein
MLDRLLNYRKLQEVYPIHEYLSRPGLPGDHPSAGRAFDFALLF